MDDATHPVYQPDGVFPPISYSCFAIARASVLAGPRQLYIATCGRSLSPLYSECTSLGISLVAALLGELFEHPPASRPSMPAYDKHST